MTRVNLLRPGPRYATFAGQILDGSASAAAVLERTVGAARSRGKTRRQRRAVGSSALLPFPIARRRGAAAGSLLHARLRFHRVRRTEALGPRDADARARRPATRRRPRARLRGLDRDRAGDANDLRADRGRRARLALRGRRGPGAGYRRRPRQRSDGRFAHVHDRRRRRRRSGTRPHLDDLHGLGSDALAERVLALVARGETPTAIQSRGL